MAENKADGWHLKKEVNIAHVLTTLIVIVSGFWFFADLDKRIDTNAQELKHVKLMRAESQKMFEKRLDSMDAKLDKLLEKM